jgi:hypothetical protein
VPDLYSQRGQLYMSRRILRWGLLVVRSRLRWLGRFLERFGFGLLGHWLRILGYMDSTADGLS